MDNNYNYLVIDLLGDSLRKIGETKYPLQRVEIINIGLQIFQRIQMIHEKFLIHRDIKPDNFLFDVKKDILYLIDFGLCKRYYDEQHIKEKKLTKIIGSYNYVSLNLHNFIEPSRRDDLESAIYILIFLHFGKLGWENKADSDIYKMKENIMTIHFIPDYIKTLLTYVRSLKFEEDPDYHYIFDIFRKETDKDKYKDNQGKDSLKL
jgi:serine/threonine protein kinase